jgi:hypothetical protein
MTPPRPDQVVTVIAPSNAPHLGRIADETAARLLKQISALPTDTLIRLLREGEATAREREEFARFLARAPVKLPSGGA